MSQLKKLVIIAGEESGDIHAANMLRQLKNANTNLQVSGIGGRHLEMAGMQLISDLARYGVTGLSEVIRHAKAIRKAFKAIKQHLIETKPDLLVLVDYPGFNLRMARFAKEKLGIRVLYYISPQIWAWKANRIETIRKYVDRMAVILPFEKAIYEQAGIPVSFVGHPLIDKVELCQDLAKTRESLELPIDKTLIALLPGSRTHEIERHMPVLVQTAKELSAKNKNLHFAIPIAGTLDPQTVKAYFNNSQVSISFISGKAVQVAACSDCIVVASGTASLECAFLEKPMCIIYKSSFITYVAASQLIKVKYLGLCNLLQNKMVVPELLQYDCNSAELTKMVTELLTDKNFSTRMVRELQQLKRSLSAGEADCSISDLVGKEMAWVS